MSKRVCCLYRVSTGKDDYERAFRQKERKSHSTT